jgi:hypothetical protein
VCVCVFLTFAAVIDQKIKRGACNFGSSFRMTVRYALTNIKSVYVIDKFLCSAKKKKHTLDS